MLYISFSSISIKSLILAEFLLENTNTMLLIEHLLQCKLHLSTSVYLSWPPSPSLSFPTLPLILYKCLHLPSLSHLSYHLWAIFSQIMHFTFVLLISICTSMLSFVSAQFANHYHIISYIPICAETHMKMTLIPLFIVLIIAWRTSHRISCLAFEWHDLRLANTDNESVHISTFPVQFLLPILLRTIFPSLWLGI